MIPKVISFYTPNTPYQQEVIALQSSCANLGIPIEVESLESKGSWEKNVAMKPSFILRKLEEEKHPLFWVDADAVFLKSPDFSQFEKVDFSVRFMAVFKTKPEHAINSATMFINYTEEAMDLIKAWVRRTEKLCASGKTPKFVDQIALYEVLLENKRARVLPLDVSYCKIYDLDQFFIDDDQVVIEQRQASRQYQ